MRSRLAVVFSIFMLMAVPFSGHTAGNNLSDVFLADLDFLYAMGNDIYCYWDLKKEMYGVDWDGLYKSARSKMVKAKEPTDYFETLYEMIAAVKDGHVNVWPNFPYEPFPYYMPLKFKDIGGKVVITGLREDAFLGEPTVSVGEQVLAINGVPTEDLIDEISKYVSGSTPQMVRRSAIRWLNSYIPFGTVPESNPVLLVSVPKDMTSREAEVPWLIYDWSQDPTAIDEEWQMSDVVEGRILPGNIGYLRIKAMWGAVSYEQYTNYILNQLEYLLGTEGLIIDVRGNGGGWSGVGDRITAYLIDRPITRYSNSARLSKATLIARPEYALVFEPDPLTGGRFSTWEGVTIQPMDEGRRYHGMVIVLIDAGCFSACDTFVDGLASNGIATMMGEQTGGGTGWPLNFELPSGMTIARFSTTRGYSNFGRFLEGVGTIPDIRASLTLDDIANGRDSVLTRAHRILLSNTRTPCSSACLKSSLESGLIEEGRDQPTMLPLRLEKDIIPGFIEETNLILQNSREFENH